MTQRKARDLILMALGSPETDDASAALGCVVQALHAEAMALEQGGTLGISRETLEIAHLTRLKALEELIDAYMTVSWRETDEERTVKVAEAAE